MRKLSESRKTVVYALSGILCGSMLMLLIPTKAHATPGTVAVAPGSLQAALLGGYGKLATRWWTWATGMPFEGEPNTDLGFPITPNPITDLTGDLCEQNQHGLVFFLAGTFGGIGPLAAAERECKVPFGRYLFLPLFNTVWWFPDAPTLEGIRAIAKGQIDRASNLTMTLSVDGKPIRDLFAYRAQTPPGGGKLLVEDGSFLAEFQGEAPGELDLTVSDGYWVLLKPLAPGKHVLHFTTSFNLPDDPSTAEDETELFDLDVRYTLNVSHRRQFKR